MATQDEETGISAVASLKPDASLRDALEASFEDLSKDEKTVDGPTEDEDKGAPVEGKPDPVESEVDDDEKPAKADDKAKPAPKGKANRIIKDDASVEDVESKEVQLSKSKAPGTWKPAAREKFASLPAEVQNEVLRREREISNGFNEVANVKKFQNDFGTIVNQHQHIIAAEGGDPIKMTRDLFATAAVLYNGSAQAKAQTVAAFIHQFGIDIPMLDQVLAGQADRPPVQRQQTNGGSQDAAAFIQAEIRKALAPYEQEKEQQMGQTLEEFAADPKNEFFMDVKNDMADLLEFAARRGQKLSLQEAYKRATMLNSDIAEVIAERQIAEKAAKSSKAAKLARQKSVSLNSTPATELASGDAEVEGSGNLRSDLEAAYERLSADA